MPLNRTIDQMVSAARKCANVQGTTALVRHPDADLFDYVNRGVAALHRQLSMVDSGQRYLSSVTVTTAASQEAYSLPADFMHLISLSGELDGVQRWFTPYSMNERPELTDENNGWTGEPLYYRLRGGNISLLPVPSGVYDLTLWYTAQPSTLTTGQTFDTIARLDDFIVWYAAKEVAKKDKNWDLHRACTEDMDRMRGEIDAVGRNRDRNAPAMIIDVCARDRFGRARYGGR